MEEIKTKGKYKKLLPLLISLLVIGVVSAALVTYFGSKTTTIEVNQAITMPDCSESLTTAGGETITTAQCTATSQTSVDIPVEIKTTDNPSDGGVENVDVQYELHAEGESPREDRIRVLASDIGLNTLSDFNTASFQQNVVEGYVGHLDVLIDTTGDGIADDALVFEYAKVNPARCDETPYPTGSMNTFGELGTISDTSYAWLTTGPAGPCGASNDVFFWHSLADWKTGVPTNQANGKTISGTTPIIALEFEVDSWIETTTAKMSELTVNSADVNVITIQAGEDTVFDLVIKFANGASGNYTLTTNVEVQ